MNEQILEKTTKIMMDELASSVVGIYLHGSMAMGSYQHNHSDIDILIVIDYEQDTKTYQSIAKKLIELEEELGLIKGFEISIILKEYAENFVYPTPFEFHYSLVHKDRYLSDPNYICGGFEDTDLAAHFVIVYERGKVLYGRDIKNVFQAIDPKYYIQSIVEDVKVASIGIINDPVYYSLNLCRVLLYLRNSTISSKKEAGEWALKALSNEYTTVIDQCLRNYNNKINIVEIDEELLVDFAEHMLWNINELL